MIVDEVARRQPRRKAGLKNGDVIVEFDGPPVTTVATFRNLVSASDPGKSYALKFFRGGKEQVVQVTPAPEGEVLFAHESEQGRARARGSASGEARRLRPERPARLALRLLPPLGYPRDPTGLLVVRP